MKRIILNQVHIYHPSIDTVDNSLQMIPLTNDEFDIDNFLHYPLLINEDGSLWKYGNLYLLSKLKLYNKPSAKTLDSISIDLKLYKEWCDKENVDYLKAPRKVLRPTYLYRAYLQEQLRDSKISINTVKRRISAVIGFYRYLIEIEKVKFKFPLWEDGITSIKYQDYSGFIQSKAIRTTDIGRVTTTSNPYLFDDAIKDGGRLHPLSHKDQKILMQTLKEIGNTEITLGFLIALTTGARMQTIYTLRKKHFSQSIGLQEDTIKIKVGYGSSCDTKFQKQHTLLMPQWVYEKVCIYLASPRALKRLEKAKHIFQDQTLQYAFLNRSGVPFYTSIDDPYRKLYRDAPNGNAIRQFIHSTLKKKLAEKGIKLNFSFHDLRASFGMNLLDKWMPLVQNKEVELTKVLLEIKERMGHNSLTTTEKYLNFRDRNILKERAQDDFEKYLLNLLK